MFKKLAVSTIASAILFIPSVASAKWVNIYNDDSDGSTHYVDDKKIIQDQNKIYYWYRVDYSQTFASGAKRVDLNVAIDCFTRQQKVLETVVYGANRRVIERRSLQNGYYNPTSTFIRSGSVDEVVFNSLCSK